MFTARGKDLSFHCALIWDIESRGNQAEETVLGILADAQ